MTLTDMIELKQKSAMCRTANEIVILFDEYGEDTDENESEKILVLSKTDAFTVSGSKAVFLGKEIHCTSCQNNVANKILSNAAEILSGFENAHVGCCECGTTFSLKKLK